MGKYGGATDGPGSDLTMPPKPEYFHNLEREVAVLTAGVEVQGEAISRLGEADRVTKTEIVEVRERLAKLESSFADASKRLEAWDSRLWGLVAVLIGALLSLASGLIVALMRK
jgi:hypothetical protein